ncbi:hypothetical protein OROMI_000783 [Orobanche minor]
MWLLMGRGGSMYHYNIGTGDRYLLPPIGGDIVQNPVVAATFVPTRLTSIMWTHNFEYHIWLYKEGRWNRIIDNYAEVSQNTPQVTGLQLFERGGNVEILALFLDNQFYAINSDGSSHSFRQFPSIIEYDDFSVTEAALGIDSERDENGVNIYYYYYYSEVAPNKLEGRHGTNLTNMLGMRDLLLAGKVGIISGEREIERELEGLLSFIYWAEGKENGGECFSYWLTNGGLVLDGIVMKEYEEDVWTEIAKFLDGKSLVMLAVINRIMMEESVWKFACLRDLQVPDPGKVAFKWIKIYATAFDGSYSFMFPRQEKHIGRENVAVKKLDSGLLVIYCIKLRGPAILGEGKPENQIHAIIFTHGEG